MYLDGNDEPPDDPMYISDGAEGMDDFDKPHTKADPAEIHATTELRWLADGYEQAQRVRIQTGERLRAVLQGRDRTFAKVDISDVGTGLVTNPHVPESEQTLDDKARVEAMLDAIKLGTTLGPVPILGRTYKRMWDQEKDLYKEMVTTLKSHPAYPWFSRVKGIGATLACKMLARLDIHRAQYASSFWAYAGLATVPGSLYQCATCGLQRSYAPGYDVKGPHKSGGNGAACKGRLVLVPNAEVRVTQPHARSGEKAAYDAYMKKIMYLVGTSFLKAGGPYKDHYAAKRVRLMDNRLGWAPGRIHLTALRHAEKLFLSHLWEVWRKAENLPTPEHYVIAQKGHDKGSIIDPWSMVEPEKPAKVKRPKKATAA